MQEKKEEDLQQILNKNSEVGIDEVAGSVETVESTHDGRLMRFSTEVPLAGHHGAVTAFAKELC